MYGPAATAVEAVAARLGGTSMAWIAFWIKVVNGICFVAVAALLDRLAGPDQARRARAALLWAVNPLMLFWMVIGHTRTCSRCCRCCSRCWPGGRCGNRWRAAARPSPPRPRGSPGGAIVLAAGYAVAGPAAWKSLSQRLSSAHDSFLPLPGAVYLHPAAYAGVTLALVLGDIVQYPWYDAMFFPLLALLPASRLAGSANHSDQRPAAARDRHHYGTVPRGPGGRAGLHGLSKWCAVQSAAYVPDHECQDGRPGERTVQPASVHAAASRVPRASIRTGRATTDFRAAGSIER